MKTIVICDDEEEQLKSIRKMTDEFLHSRETEAVSILEFSDPQDFREWLEDNPAPDLALLDICMPQLSGVSLARIIREKGKNSLKDTKIIFLTTSREYALDAFDVNAVHYLVKPFTAAQFSEAMSRVKALSDPEIKKIAIHSGGEVVTLLDVREIQCIESIGYRRYVRTSSAEFTETRRTLKEFSEELQKLCPCQFFTPYRGYIVNLSAIRTISPKGIELKNGSVVFIKTGDFRVIKKRWFDYMFDSETK